MNTGVKYDLHIKTPNDDINMKEKRKIARLEKKKKDAERYNASYDRLASSILNKEY